MKSLSQRLTQIESRLQSLIEGSAARLFPQESQINLPIRLVRAMQAALQSDETGAIFAPNLYELSLHPSIASNLLENQSALKELALVIQQAGLEAGLRFNTPPMVKILPDPELDLPQVSIDARITPSNLGKTRTLIQETQNDLVEAIPANAFLIVEGGRIFPLSQVVINIGRRVDNHLTIEDPRVSRLHAQLRVIKGQFVLFDLNSTGGTSVNGKRIKKASLNPGDVVSLAGVLLVYGQDASMLTNDTHDGSTHPIIPYPADD